MDVDWNSDTDEDLVRAVGQYEQSLLQWGGDTDVDLVRAVEQYEQLLLQVNMKSFI